MHKKFYTSLWFWKKKSNIFIFSESKIAVKYAKIDMLGSLDADFQPVPHFQNFWNFQNIVMEYQ